MKKSQKRIWSIVALVLLCVAINRYAHLQQHKLAGDLPRFANRATEQPQAVTIDPNIPEGARVLEARSPQRIGWAGETPLSIVLSKDGKIVSLSFLPNNETPGFIRSIENSDFMNSWNGLTLCQAVNHQVDALSGATITTINVIHTLRDDIRRRIEIGEIECDGEKALKAGKDWERFLRLSASLLVLALALLSFFFPKKMNPARLYLLALSVIVLGFWQGQYLSVTYFFNVLSHGFNWTVWVLPLMLLLAFVLPLITKKSFYCMYICPFGAAQELVSKLNKKHVKIPQKVYNVLISLRPLYLLVIIALLFTGTLSDFANFEPFAGFMLDVNLWIPMVIAGTFLLVSIFSPRFWCKYCCPTGYMTDMVR
ncbi:MAG: 4Fe-4S binding protein [Bacteroidales bacterium]|nr:4Fe-4S binding protein [Bacteroidales bacterium]